MELALSKEDRDFAERMRDFFTTEIPADIRARRASGLHATKEEVVTSQQIMNAHGYAVPHWPLEWGGQDWTPLQRHLWAEEMTLAYVPPPIVFNTAMVGPVIANFGTEELKQRFLPQTANADIWWSQGFSEPNAGSDLASLKTSAVRDGDHYIVNGQKIWTSHAEVADFCELLVRTDPTAPKHRGISWLIVPMTLPGIEIRPLRTLVGSTEFSEVFFDNVRVPVSNRVGAENDGWRVTMVTLSFERGTAFVSDVVNSMVMLHDVADIARKSGAWDDAALRREVGHLAAELDALWALTRRTVTQAERGTGVPGLGGSVFKLAYTEARSRLGDLALRILGPDAMTLGNEHVQAWVQSMSLTIAAGTSQIQRNIVAERILGMPK